MGFFAGFHDRGASETSLNVTLISLLPKVAGADAIMKFR